jgi:hypothetical protein
MALRSTEAAKAFLTRGSSKGGARVLKVATKTVGHLVLSTGNQGMSVPSEVTGKTTEPGRGVGDGVSVGGIVSGIVGGPVEDAVGLAAVVVGGEAARNVSAVETGSKPASRVKEQETV